MTNNRLECSNGKLKQVISRYCSFEEFVAKFFIILTSLRTDKAALMCQKVKVQPYKKDTPESDYSLLLTPYAFLFVHKQLQLVDAVFTTTSDGVHTVNTSEGSKIVSSECCRCMFFSSMKLPCHILALRVMLEIPLF